MTSTPNWSPEIKRAATGIAVVLLAWIGSQMILISPLVNAVKDLVKDNKIEHNLIIDKLQYIDGRVVENKSQIDKTKPLLFRVVKDCNEHHGDIKNCMADFWSRTKD